MNIIKYRNSMACDCIVCWSFYHHIKRTRAFAKQDPIPIEDFCKQCFHCLKKEGTL